MKITQELNDEFQYKATIIIPVYNAEKYLEECLNSLLSQTISQMDMEVIMINDGSIDNSLQICERYVQNNSNFKLLSQENKGVSSARNNGIKNAKGKYIFFLDSDDTYSQETVKNVVDFFDNYVQEIDIVTFPIIFVSENGNKSGHYRYKLLKKTGIYDINETQYVSLTTINVAVKNQPQPILFNEDMHYHEDEDYLTKFVFKRKKFGVVCEAKYFYKKHKSSKTSNTAHPYYCFESEMAFYERLYKEYVGEDRMPAKYVQELVMSDWGWKIKEDKMFPYHYSPEELKKVMERFKKLLNQTDDNVILHHPNIESYHRYFLLALKNEGELFLKNGENILTLCKEKRVLSYATSITAIFTKIKTHETYIEVHGFLKSPFFLFSPKPDLFVNINFDNNMVIKEQLNLRESAHDYYKTKIKTNKFFRFEFRVEIGVSVCFSLQVQLNSENMALKYYFMPEAVFRNGLKGQSFYRHGNRYSLQGLRFLVQRKEKKEYTALVRRKNNLFWKKRKKFWIVRTLAILGLALKKQIWLYCDCKGVGKDNGYYQFLHDVQQDDNIERYYVIHEEEFVDLAKEDGITDKQLIFFGSKRHKFMYLRAKKVITGYIERYNYMPFDIKTYESYRDIHEPEIVYLQHGVLHAHAPWKYSFDRLNIDKEVVSTLYEVENLVDNYNFRKENILLTGMPRYDFIDCDYKNKGEKKILFAPSWRNYLITLDNEGVWIPDERLFKESVFFKEIQAFLENERLHKGLEKYGYTLEFKLHPIFKCYENIFLSFNFNKRINISNTNINAAEYDIFITDFSSFSFDFVYLRRTIIYFLPDYDMFKAGLNGYRKLDLPLENAFGPFVQTANEAVKVLNEIMSNNGQNAKIYQERMEKFFLFYDNKQRLRLYNALINGEEVTIEDIFVDLLK